MDVLTHLLLPYAGALAFFGLRRNRVPSLRTDAGALALVFGAAGAAPDLDSVYSWMKTMPGLWWLQHRGVSHTLLFAPLHALAAVGILDLLARRWPDQLGRLRFRRAFVPVAVVGSWVHLILDGVTYAGTPALFPFSFTRVTFPLFHWLVIWLFPLTALFLIVKWWRGLDPSWTVRAGALAFVLLLVVAGVRVSTRPTDEGPEAMVLPRNSMFEWTVLQPHDNGSWEAYLYRAGERSQHRFYEEVGPRDADALDAIRRARSTDNYHGYLMGLFGPEVTNVTRDDGGTNVTFTSVAQRFEVESGFRWTPAEPQDAWGVVSFRLEGDRIWATARGW